jgi:hypothetical protein
MPRGGAGTVATFRPWMPPPWVPPEGYNPANSPYWFLAFAPQELWDKDKYAWTYEADFNPILGGQTLVQFIPVKVRGGFLLTTIAAVLTDTSNPPIIFWGNGAVGFNAPSNILVQFSAVKKKYDFFSQPAPLDNVAGAGAQSPGIPVPYYFDEGEVLGVRAQSLWARSLTNRILRLSFHGAIFR